MTDIATARRFFAEQLGMRLMSVQPVDDFGFCLYFYSWSYEPLPDPDLTAIGNREWLWARSYTFIELQHLQGANATIHKTPADQAGFDGFAYGEPQASDVNFVSIDDLTDLT